MKVKSINPHNQKVVFEFSTSTSSEIRSIVATAHERKEFWKKTPLSQKLDIFRKYAALLKESQKEIAKLVTLEMGRPLNHTMMDIDWELNYVQYYIDHAESVFAAQTLEKNSTEHFYLVREPVGVVACICPWNFPISMAHSGVLPALLAGNTVILKPSEFTTASQSKVKELLEKAGLPEGVLQVVIGDGKVGKKLLGQDINMVWFTGSSATGRQIYKTCGERFIKCVCEMGGSSAAIVCKDADMENAVNSIYFSRFNNSGQACKAVKRLVIENEVFDLFLKKLAEKVEQVRVGNPLDEVDMGPLASVRQLKQLQVQVDDALQKGAKITTARRPDFSSELQAGNYFAPILLTHVTSQMKVLTEEVFGPVLPVLSFSTMEEAIELANSTQFGLTSEVFTKDMTLARKYIDRLESGVVAVNTDRFYRPYCPIGGFKQSGMGKEYGEIGMQEFTQTKLVAIYDPK